MTRALRWKLWEFASWLAYWLCPDKEALGLIQSVGTERVRQAMDEARASRNGK